ncbi:MAG: hypothetical protein IJ457_06020, partial [Clostridia bacterium]|nr:hypothetical protein [Clostridia bacterium]
ESESESITESESESITESESESITESESVTEQSTETESEAVTPTEPPKPTEPTEPEPPRTEPEESTVHAETSRAETDAPTVVTTQEPVAPSDSETDEPKESLPESTTPSTKPNGTFVAVTENDGNAVTDVGIAQTNGVTEQTTAPTLPATTPPTPDIPPETTRPSGGGNSFDEGTDDPGENEYEKYYTGVAPTTGSSSQVSAHYLTRIPESFCKPENLKSTTEDKVFGSCTDIFSGSLVSLKSVEITILEVERVYVSVLEVKLNGDILRNSGNLSENETVRILLPHGVNTTDEGLYDAKDIAGLLGEADLLQYGFGVFCVDSIGDKRLDLAGQYYKYSAIADYVLTDGMNDLILSNSYYTFFNEKTYSNLVEKLGPTPSMGDIIDYFNELKKDGHI